MQTKVKITSLEARKWRDSVLEREDPRGRPYYWLWGSRMPHFRKDSDAFAVHKLKAISVCPLSLDLTPNTVHHFREFESSIVSKLKKLT